jgi:hypothetical protein
MRIYSPIIILRKIANILNSPKPIVTIKNGRIEFFATNRSIGFRAPTGTSLQTGIIETLISFNFDAELPTTSHFIITLLTVKTATIELTAIGRRFVTTATNSIILKASHILIIPSILAMLTIKKSVTPATIAISVIIGTTAKIVRMKIIDTTLAPMPIRSFPTILTKHLTITVDQIALIVFFLAIVTEITTEQFSTVDTNSTVVKSVIIIINPNTRIDGRIVLTATIGTLGTTWQGVIRKYNSQENAPE